MNSSQTGTPWAISVSIGVRSTTKPSARDGSTMPFMISRPRLPDEQQVHLQRVARDVPGAVRSRQKAEVVQTRPGTV